MNKRTLLTVALAALLSLPLALSAADEAKKKGPSFSDICAGKDHATLADFKKSMAGGKMDDAAIEKRFKALDADSNGKVTQEEWSAGQKKKKEGGK
jgi:hypothetical protein